MYQIYFILVVYSYHEALREDPSGTTAGFPGPVPMVIAGFPGPVPMVIILKLLFIG